MVPRREIVGVTHLQCIDQGNSHNPGVEPDGGGVEQIYDVFGGQGS